MDDKNKSPETTAELRRTEGRRVGWTVERQQSFLKALAACGCVSHACSAVGMSRQSAYRLYNLPSASVFRRAWDDALDCALRLVEDQAIARAINGVPKPIFHKGELVGEYRHYDDRLAMFLLRYRRRYRYGPHLDRVPVPIPPPQEHVENEALDPDEGIGSLEFYLEDLVAEAELPGGDIGASRANDSVNFVNFDSEQPIAAAQAPADDCDGSSALLEPPE